MSKTRSRSAARRPAARTRKGAGTKSRGSKKPSVIRLKPLYNEIGRVLKQLEQLQKRQGPAAAAAGLAEGAAAPSDSVSRAIARLTQHRADFDDICGPTMQVPAP